MWYLCRKDSSQSSLKSHLSSISRCKQFSRLLVCMGPIFSSRAYYLIHIYQLFFVGIWQWSHFLFLQYLLFFILVKYFPAGVWRLCASAKALHRRWVRGGRRAWTQSQAWGRFEHYNDDEDDGDDYEEEEEEELEPNPKLGAGKQGDDDEDDDDDDGVRTEYLRNEYL